MYELPCIYLKSWSLLEFLSINIPFTQENYIISALLIEKANNF